VGTFVLIMISVLLLVKPVKRKLRSTPAQHVQCHSFFNINHLEMELQKIVVI